jgi:predicted dehydrogenase
MSRPLRWGVLSTASINAKMLAAAALCDAVDVVAVASRDRAKSETYAANWGIPKSFGGYDDLLADESVEVVYISLPNGMHHEWTMRALRAGKHVLCEKPYSRSPIEVEEAFSEAQQRGLILSEAFMFRYHPQMVRLHEMVLQERVIGELRLIASSFSWPNETSDHIVLDLALEGGSLLDVGVYCLSVGRLLAGEPRTATAQQITEASGVDESFVATMEFDSTVLAHFDCSIQLPHRSHLEVVGSLGSITVSDPWICDHPALTVNLRDGASWVVAVPEADSYQLELEEFGKAVRGETNTLLSRVDALGQARAVDALFRAANTGQRVQLDDLVRSSIASA